MVVAPYLDTLLLLLVAAAAINDLASRRIPNLLLLSGLVAALVLHAISPDPGAALLACLGGTLAGLLLFMPFYIARGMAAGDVKMMATVGAFTGPAVALNIAILTWCVGGMMALAIILYRRRLGPAVANLCGMLLRILSAIVCRGRLGLVLANLGSMLRVSLLARFPARPRMVTGSVGSMPYGVAIAVGTIYVLMSRYA